MDKEYTTEGIQSFSAGEAIRMRPHLYFEKCFQEKTLDSLPFEVLCHAFDEYFDGSCKLIEMSMANDSFTVSYDTGLSLERTYDGLSKAEIIMTQILACRNEKKHLAVGEEFCSLGMAVINIASEQCELITVCNSMCGHYRFENGITISSAIEPAQALHDFTRIFMKPDKAIFGSLAFTLDGVNERAKQINSKLPGLEIVVRNDIKAE